MYRCDGDASRAAARPSREAPLASSVLRDADGRACAGNGVEGVVLDRVRQDTGRLSVFLGATSRTFPVRRRHLQSWIARRSTRSCRAPRSQHQPLFSHARTRPARLCASAGAPFARLHGSGLRSRPVPSAGASPLAARVCLGTTPPGSSGSKQIGRPHHSKPCAPRAGSSANPSWPAHPYCWGSGPAAARQAFSVPLAPRGSRGGIASRQVRQASPAEARPAHTTCVHPSRAQTSEDPRASAARCESAGLPDGAQIAGARGRAGLRVIEVRRRQGTEFRGRTARALP